MPIFCTLHSAYDKTFVHAILDLPGIVGLQKFFDNNKPKIYHGNIFYTAKAFKRDYFDWNPVIITEVMSHFLSVHLGMTKLMSRSYVQVLCASVLSTLLLIWHSYISPNCISVHSSSEHPCRRLAGCQQTWDWTPWQRNGHKHKIRSSLFQVEWLICGFSRRTCKDWIQWRDRRFVESKLSAWIS